MSRDVQTHEYDSRYEALLFVDPYDDFLLRTTGSGGACCVAICAIWTADELTDKLRPSKV